MNRLFLFVLVAVCNIGFPFFSAVSAVASLPVEQSSVLGSGKWVKAQTQQSGIHRITFAALKSMGFQSPQNVRIFGFPSGPLPQMNRTAVAEDLIQYACWQTTDKQGNDCLIMYIPGNISWVFDPPSGLYVPVINQFAQGTSQLFLSEDIVVSKTVGQLPSSTKNSTGIVTEFDDFDLFEETNYNLIESGSRWYSAKLSPNTTLTRSFNFPDHVINEPYRISVAAAGRCDSQSSLAITVNNSTAETLSFFPYTNSVEADYAYLNEHIFSNSTASDDLSLLMKYSGTSNGLCWLDYVRVQTRRKLNMQPGQLQFRDSRSVGSGDVVEFRMGNATSGIKIWDVTSPLHPLEIQSVITSGLLSFKVEADSLRRFIAFDPMFDFPGIEKAEVISNQNLHGLSAPDMLIVTSSDFNSEAERLASFHRQNSAMDVTVVNSSQIFNEFSGGIADVTAIRNFVRFLYRQSPDKSMPKLKYLLLFGKGTYDNVHPLSEQNPCFVPTWQSDNSVNPISSFVSDDYFGLLGQDEGSQTGIVDLGIGRIPCANVLQAKAAVDKIIHYNSASTLGAWRNVVCFVGDDGDDNVHVSDSEQLADSLNHYYPAYFTNKIYLDAFPKQTTPTLSYPGVNKAINNQVKDGVLLINYVGHANEEEWAAEKVLTISDIDSWSNWNKLPVFVTATCEFSRWDMTGKESAGEHLLFNQVGGGIALFSTTRMVFSSQNFEMNRSFFRYVFKKDLAGNDLRMGDIIRLAKGELGGSINASKFALLGDPALQICYPKNQVKILEINGQDAEQMKDTIRPLSLVSVWGEIQDSKGEKLTGYNGLLYPNVYDKMAKVTTLGNIDQLPFQYTMQNSVIFKGNVTVRGGEFSYTFEVPKEINYRIGEGMIRNYSANGDTDANGTLTLFKLGGSPNAILTDVTGPTVKLFLDDENFKSGDRVSKAPLLMVNLDDDSGINTSGGGIGHDITVLVDNQTENMIVLNDYFQSGLDSYKNGKVIYQLSPLADGEHTLKFKVWDLANNSTEMEVRFFVSSGVVIKKVTAFPNPLNEFTDFVAEYNRYGEKMTIEIKIFNQLGVLVDQIKTESASTGFTTPPIRWSPGINNPRLASGIYYYRIRLTAVDGSSDSGTGQLIYTH